MEDESDKSSRGGFTISNDVFAPSGSKKARSSATVADVETVDPGYHRQCFACTVRYAGSRGPRRRGAIDGSSDHSDSRREKRTQQRGGDRGRVAPRASLALDGQAGAREGPGPSVDALASLRHWRWTDLSFVACRWAIEREEARSE